MPPLVSLIVPYYRQPDTLPRLLDSILQQSQRPLEVILVDDHSQDAVAEIVRQWQQKGLDIHLVTQPEHVYTLQCRLDGIRYAHGDIIGFADADDILWGTEALAQNVRMISERHGDILHFRTAIIDAEGNFVRYDATADPLAKEIYGIEHILDIFYKAKKGGAWTLWSKLFARKICEQALGSYTTYFKVRNEDGWLFLNILLHAKKYLGSDNVGYGYWYIPKNQTTKTDRTIASYHFYRKVPELLRSHGISEQFIERFRYRFEEVLCLTAGHMCKAWRNLSTEEWQVQLAAIKASGCCEDLLEALIAANGINAERLLAIRRVFP